MNKLSFPLNRSTELVSSGVVAVVSCQCDDQFDIIPLGFSMAGSTDPPLVVIGVRPGRYSYDLIKNSGEFVVNVASPDIADEIGFCGTYSGRDVDKFAATGLRRAKAKVVSVPLIEQCIGHVECKVIAAPQPGSHVLFTGQIVAASVADGAFGEVRWRLDDPHLSPLFHFAAMDFAIVSHIYTAHPEAVKPGTRT